MNESKTQIKTHPLTADDFDRVVNIDAKIVGRRRPGFFEKRLAAAIAEPDFFIYIGCEGNGELQGYLLARLHGGEFGISRPIAILDAMGVDSGKQGQGIGRKLMQEFERILINKKVTEIQTQADWRRFDFLRFLSAAGFQLAPIQVLEREVSYIDTKAAIDPVDTGNTTEGEKDYSDPGGDSTEALARDQIYCRNLTTADLPQLIRIDKKATGNEHAEYYERKIKEVLDESGIRVSLVAEVNDEVVGFIMARVDYGEFDRTEPIAVLDSIAVTPGYGNRRVGSALLSQLLANLTSLRLESIRTVIMSGHFDILKFLMKNGFNPSQRLALSYSLA